MDVNELKVVVEWAIVLEHEHCVVLVTSVVLLVKVETYVLFLYYVNS